MHEGGPFSARGTILIPNCVIAMLAEDICKAETMKFEVRRGIVGRAQVKWGEEILG
jgi:hypothetical protein